MREQGLDDAAMASRVGDITEHGIRKLKYGERGPSIETAIRINEVTDGEVGLLDWARGERSVPPSEATPADQPPRRVSQAAPETGAAA